MLNQTQTRNFKFLRSILLAGGVTLAAAGIAVLLAFLWLNPPMKELGELFSYLLISGSISVLLGVGWLVYASQNTRLQLQLIVTYLVGAVIALVNIGVTASLMFLSAHDFTLLTLLLIFSGSISIFFAYYISTQLTRQVRQLVQGANQLASGKLDTRVKGGGNRELVELSQAFNQMATNLQTSFEKQRQVEQSRKELIAAIGHDLRTPLASLRLMAEAIQDGVTDDQQTKMFMGRISGEVTYMSGLIEDLFELSQLDAGSLKLRCEPGNLSDLISDTLESMRAQAEIKHQSLNGEIEGHIPLLSFDMRKIQRVLNNLVGNAIRYTPEGGKITLRAWAEFGKVLVSVIDNGEGINPTDLERIFEPFYRGERSRGREHGGAGLGLAISKGLIEAHNGTIRVESREGKGSTFTFQLPL